MMNIRNSRVKSSDAPRLLGSALLNPRIDLPASSRASTQLHAWSPASSSGSGRGRGRSDRGGTGRGGGRGGRGGSSSRGEYRPTDDTFRSEDDSRRPAPDRSTPPFKRPTGPSGARAYSAAAFRPQSDERRGEAVPPPTATASSARDASQRGWSLEPEVASTSRSRDTAAPTGPYRGRTATVERREFQQYDESDGGGGDDDDYDGGGGGDGGDDEWSPSVPRSQQGGRRERGAAAGASPSSYRRGDGNGGGPQPGVKYYDSRGNERPFYETPSTALRDGLRGEVLYGVFPVLAALRNKRREMHELFVMDSMDMSKRKDSAAVQEVLRLARQLDLPMQYVGRHELNMLSQDRPHQGLILDAGALGWDRLEEFPTADEACRLAAAEGRPTPVWLALDEVVDPQNLGAVLRSAYCLGAAGVLGCSKNCAPLSAVVSKASSGALEVMTVHSCTNMPRTLAAARDDGWAVLGAAADSNAVGVSGVDVERPTILVVGSEGFGLRANVRRACSQLVKVEMDLPRRSDRTVDSLNVSVATGVLLHSLVESARRQTRAAATAAAEDASTTAPANTSDGNVALAAAAVELQDD